MMKNLMKKMMMVMLSVLIFSAFGMNTDAAQVEDTETEEVTLADAAENPDLVFEIAIFTYEIIPEATEENMPVGFTLDDWNYKGVPVKAGFTENSNMVCVMGRDLETGYEYRFIYDPDHDMFVPYFGMEVKDGYIYTVPMYEDAEIPYGFVESYFVIQTVPMFTYMREDAELTQEEIAVGSLSEDNYLVFLMMDERGREEHYTYDLIDRTFQRSLLQKKDAEKVTELNEVIDGLHVEIGKLNATHAERMNGRLTLIGVLIAVIVIMAGVMVNLILKLMKLKNSEEAEVEDEEEALDFEADAIQEAIEEASAGKETEAVSDDELEIVDLDLEDL